MEDISFLKNNLIAHRGYHDIKNKVPENSIKAFKRAINHNYVIELDVHLTKDGYLVVFHDENLKRVCNINKNISECTYDELLKYNLFDTNYKIPLFKEVLTLVQGKVPLLIETKYCNKYGKLEKELIKELKNYNGLYAIQSFYPMQLIWFKKHAKNVKVGLLLGKSKNDIRSLVKKIGKTLIFNIIFKIDFISYNVKGRIDNLSKSKRKKEFILGWTIRKKEDYYKYKNYYDNLICENMEEFKK